MPRTRVEVKDEDGRIVTYEGVLVGEILKRAGVPLGAELRGNAVATYVVASATDGYQVVFSLAELDPGFTSNDIIVADTDRRQAAVRLSGAVAHRRAEGLARRALDPDAASGSKSCASGSSADDDVAGCVVRRRASGSRPSAGAQAPAQAAYDWRLPAGFPRAARAGRQPDVRGQGRARASSVLRHAAVRRTARSRAPPATSRRGRSPTAARGASARPASCTRAAA